MLTWVRLYLDARRDVINDPDGFAVRVAGERVGDDMVLHLARGLVAGLNSVDGLAGGTLKAAVLVAVVVHRNKALEVVLVTTLRQAAHRLSPGDATDTRAFVARWPGQCLHTDGAVLRWEDNLSNLIWRVGHVLLYLGLFCFVSLHILKVTVLYLILQLLCSLSSE